MELGVLGGLIGLAMVATLVLLVMALVDLVKRPPAIWTASRHSQLVWALIVVFVGLVGPLLYLLIARPALQAASAQAGVQP